MSLQVDRKVLLTQYSRDNLSIHYKLISLYVTNLNSIGTTSALIAQLSFACLHEFDYPTKHITPDWRLGYLYTFFAMIAIITAILTLLQSTICLIFSPTMFLFGNDHYDSLSALYIMKKQQEEAGFWSVICVFMSLSQALVYTWGVAYWPCSIGLTIVHFCGYYIIYSQGKKTINLFSPPSHTPHEQPKTQGFSLLRLTSDVETPDYTPNLQAVTNSEMELAELKLRLLEVRRRGYLWTKNVQSMYQTDYFVRIYAVLEKGFINFYREEEVSVLFFSPHKYVLARITLNSRSPSMTYLFS
jgi:hypothetical protein